MKKLFLFFLLTSLPVIAQQFDKKWDAVIALEKAGKIKSAHTLVDKIYNKAVSSNNEEQLIRCFFYNSKYIQTVEEDSQTKILNNLKHQIKTVSEPSKAILNLIYAKCLNDYYSENNGKIYNRTTTDSLDTDFLLWSNKNFKKQISLAFAKSIANEAILKKASLKSYQSLFDYYSPEKLNEQNLYEFLLNENINYFTKTLYSWNIETSIFAKSKDTLYGDSNTFQSLNLDLVKDDHLKKLITLYQKKENNNNSLDNRFSRMQFCYKYLNKNATDYLNALDQIQDKDIPLLLLQDIQIEKANLYTTLASKDSHPDYNLKAIALFDTILSTKSRSNAYKRAFQRKHELEKKNLDIRLLEKSYNNENTRAFVNYKNINTLSISYFKIDQKTISKLKDWRMHMKKDSIAATIIEKNTLVKSITKALPNKNDYFSYSTEILLPQLETGCYLVYFESDSDIKNTKAFAYETITVTNLTVLTDYKNETNYYQILDRKTGKPIEKASIKFNNTEIVTDKNGYAGSKRDDNIQNYFDIIVTKENDTLTVSNRNRYENNTFYKKSTDAKIEFYLDRAIYRPGQTVYYKGIVFQKKANETRIVPNILMKIIVKDNNNKNIQNFEVTTNSFGSFSGEFQLPQNGLTGNFTFQAEEPDSSKKGEHPFWDTVNFENSGTRFRVEEYKRPKFEVAFDPIKESYEVNQKIRVEGFAKSFSGATISDSKVKYRISYMVYSVYDNSYRYKGQGGATGSGETTTDAYGKFNIDFIANANQRFPKEDRPIYKFYIDADVTDSNGETHTATQTINVGYHTMNLDITIPKEINTKDKNAVEINSKNLNEQFAAIKGEVNLYFLKSFPNKIKPRVWPIPEIEAISKQDFESLFPFENNEKPVDEKELGTLVYSKKVDTEKDKAIALDFISNYQSGYYKFVFTATDINELPLEKQVLFKINQSSEKLDFNKLLSIEQLNKNPKKDGFVLLNIKSVIPNHYFKIMASYANKLFYDENKTLENNELLLKIPLQRQFEKSIKIGLESIFENQSFTQELEVVLKAEETSLDFTVESFRNKIQPGSTENWSFKLAPTNTVLEAEVLASMYDSSLDQFAKGFWNPLTLDRYVYNSISYRNKLGFNKTSATLRNLNTTLYSPVFIDKRTQLLWFGFNFADPKDYATISKYQKFLSKQNKNPQTTSSISGIITDENGDPLPGASITLKGTQTATTSDYEGYFEINASQSETLVIAYIGYQTQTILIDKNNEMNINLQPESGSLEEVVVTAYGINKEKKALSYATQTLDRKVSAETIRGAAGERIVEEDNQIYNTAGIEISLEGSAAGKMIKSAAKNKDIANAIYIIDGNFASKNQAIMLDYLNILSIEVLEKDQATTRYGTKGENGAVIITTNKALKALSEIKSRTNLSETAFFYPNLKTDKSGKISFNFTSPEALTAWKLRLFAHNKKAVSGYLEKIIVTQKDLMVIPNFPRFFREKDSIQIISKIVNMTSEPKIGIAVLQLFDATTMESVDTKMLNTKSLKNYSIPAFGNTTVSWNIYIPQGIQGVQYKVLAKADNYSDGEENIIPVLTNNILVTESIPLWVRENSKKEYTFENLRNNASTSLRNHQFTLEYTSNPTWLALQSLPYLMEYEHEGAEQTFARFYANALAGEVINSNPKIAVVFETWRKNEKHNSKLEENEELKSILLAETPWVNDAQSEEEKKQQLATLFDLEKMKNAQEATFDKLKQKQKASGGFPWYGGNEENEYITRHILAGLGHLKKINTDDATNAKIDEISKSGIPFLDIKFLENHKQRTNNLKNGEKLIWMHPYSNLHYLYTRTFYLKNYPLSDTLKKATKIYVDSAKENWLSYSLYEKGMAALVLNRFGEPAAAKIIIESLKETASNNEDCGMYWIANKSGWYWYQAPIETQALLIEAFTEVSNDTKSVDAMKVWLLKNKQAKNWPTTKATTEAVYALLMQGTDWLSVKDNTIIKIGDEKILTKKLNTNEKEAETGYLKLNWKASEITKEMASIKIENKSKVPGYGGVYWQYFEDLDKIKTNSDTSLSVSKELYLKKNTDKGTVLQKIITNNPLNIGDLVTVRLIISTKEDMEFVHLKDMRASCFEPIDVLSNYQYKDNLGFYKSTKDAATHFFFDKIDKGTYVLEYDVRVNNKGNFSNGISTIQSMYAPEFSSHTKGIKVQVAN
ncbi:Alpha-2-macroglobulin family protein [Flavobacterium gillisiae]|uniref:Alpha-2-macroglobulin family protein n=1 Tax=Flavobacterium gillisiae TaxID=150146 RepID=A0A1H4ELL4_9FLAO|nr:carboxypeptidase-like regulatory domain-containing protein [Flavobacterium gillisiae]SEA85729.1 Alpha-2-macroglobulin family protein [Flavobacterium gillisiae]